MVRFLHKIFLKKTSLFSDNFMCRGGCLRVHRINSREHLQIASGKKDPPGFQESPSEADRATNRFSKPLAEERGSYNIGFYAKKAFSKPLFYIRPLEQFETAALKLMNNWRTCFQFPSFSGPLFSFQLQGRRLQFILDMFSCIKDIV